MPFLSYPVYYSVHKVQTFYFHFLSFHFFTDLKTAHNPTSVSGKLNLHLFFRLPLRSVWLWEPLKNASQNWGSKWIRPKDYALGAIGKPREAKPIKRDLLTSEWNILDVHTFKLLRHDIVAVGAFSVAELRRLRWYPKTNDFCFLVMASDNNQRCQKFLVFCLLLRCILEIPNTQQVSLVNYRRM